MNGYYDIYVPKSRATAFMKQKLQAMHRDRQKQNKRRFNIVLSVQDR